MRPPGHARRSPVEDAGLLKLALHRRRRFIGGWQAGVGRALFDLHVIDLHLIGS